MESRDIYCTICNRQLEKYGKRKGDIKKPGWVFCPKHGWIQEGVYDRKMETEKPVELTIEEISDEHEGKKRRKQERAQKSTFLHKEKKPVADLVGKVVKTIRSTSIGIIVSLVLLFTLLFTTFSLLGYLVWKGSSRKLPETKFFQAVAHDEEPAAALAKPGIPDSSQGLVSSEKSAYEVTGTSFSSDQKDLSADRQTTYSGEKNIKRPAQPQQPLAAAYTVQVGAFTNISYARSLKKVLYKKGYPVYISHSKAPRKGRLYKVNVGKFSNRKKAESVSDKLTETQSTQTFVTAFRK